MEQNNRGYRKIKQGVVVSNKMNKTVVVNVNRRIRHSRYNKVITRGKKYYAHNENENINVGDTVTIRETKPLSKMKRWTVVTSE